MESITKSNLIYLIKKTDDALKQYVKTELGHDIALGQIVSALINESD